MLTPENLTLLMFVLFGLIVLLVGVILRRRLAKKRPVVPDTIKKWAIIDGSNVMHWKGDTPQIATVRRVISRLSQDGFTVGVVFDANAGYLLSGQYLHDGVLSRALDLPEDHVMVVQNGTPADPVILTMARDMNARIVTNDRFRDWAGEFPEVRRAGYLIPGAFKGGHLHLRMAQSNKTRKRRAV